MKHNKLQVIALVCIDASLLLLATRLNLSTPSGTSGPGHGIGCGLGHHGSGGLARVMHRQQPVSDQAHLIHLTSQDCVLEILGIALVRSALALRWAPGPHSLGTPIDWKPSPGHTSSELLVEQLTACMV